MLPQVNDFSHKDARSLTVPAAKSVYDCAKIKSTTDSNLLALGVNTVMNATNGVTWSNPYDPLSGSFDPANPSRLIIPRAGLKRISWFLPINFFHDTISSSIYAVIRLNGATDLLFNIDYGFDNTTSFTAPVFDEGQTGSRVRQFNAGDYLEIMLNFELGTTLTRKMLAGAYLAYHSLTGDP